MEKLYSEEEREEIAAREKSRTISDAKLLQAGSEYIIDEYGNKILNPSQKAIEDIDFDEKMEEKISQSERWMDERWRG